jgi:hypothetical protein
MKRKGDLLPRRSFELRCLDLPGIDPALLDTVSIVRSKPKRI